MKRRHLHSKAVRGRPARMLAAVTERRGTIHPTLGSCWECRNKPGKGGYTYVNIDGRPTLAHRWAYRSFVGPIPDGLEIDHLCVNPRCIRPSHLEAVTAAVNSQRRSAAITNCPSGHAYDDTNTYMRPDGARDCRECINERSRRRNKRRWAATKAAR